MTDSLAPNPERHTPFEILQFRVAEAHWRWKIWKQLFAGTRSNQDEVEQRISLMNRTASAFFTVIQQILLDDVIARVCKLLDPGVQGPKKRENLSLESAISRASKRIEGEKLAAATEQLKKFKVAALPLVEHRNWRIAHDDFLVAIGEEKVPALVLDDAIDGALQSAELIMELLDPNMATNQFLYGQMIARGDGDSLLRALRYADQYRKECRAQGRQPLA
jgi:hypothetical protein